MPSKTSCFGSRNSSKTNPKIIETPRGPRRAPIPFLALFIEDYGKPSKRFSKAEESRGKTAAAGKHRVDLCLGPKFPLAGQARAKAKPAKPVSHKPRGTACRSLRSPCRGYRLPLLGHFSAYRKPERAAVFSRPAAKRQREPYGSTLRVSHCRRGRRGGPASGQRPSSGRRTGRSRPRPAGGPAGRRGTGGP